MDKLSHYPRLLCAFDFIMCRALWLLQRSPSKKELIFLSLTKPPWVVVDKPLYFLGKNIYIYSMKRITGGKR